MKKVNLSKTSTKKLALRNKLMKIWKKCMVMEKMKPKMV